MWYHITSQHNRAECNVPGLVPCNPPYIYYGVISLLYCCNTTEYCYGTTLWCFTRAECSVTALVPGNPLPPQWNTLLTTTTTRPPQSTLRLIFSSLSSSPTPPPASAPSLSQFSNVLSFASRPYFCPQSPSSEAVLYFFQASLSIELAVPH